MSHVVIVGAGPAGAALSYLLARRGVGVTLLERHTDFAREFRGEALMPSGIDALTQMGLASEFASVPQNQIDDVQIFRGSQPMARVAVRRLLGTAGPCIVSQPALLEMLAAVGGRFPMFTLHRGVTVRDVVRDGQRVVGVRADTASGSREYRGDLVIGTDGRTSVLRLRAGLDEVRTAQAFDVVWGKVPLPTAFEPAVARAYLGGAHFVLAFPSYDGRLQLAWIINKGTFGDLRRRGIEGWIAEMCGHVSADLATHLRAHVAEITQPFLLDVVCDRLVRWTAPGLLLLGDAAHPMSPVGGQGINIALRDALVAANHLVPVLLQSGSAADVDAAAAAIERERLPEVATIQQLQQAPPRAIFGNGRMGRAVVSVVVPFFLRTGIARLAFGASFRRFANGVADVRLSV